MASQKKTNIESHFDQLESKVSKPPLLFDPLRHKDETRARIAMIFTWGFFLCVLITLVGGAIYNALLPNSQVNIKDMLISISSVIGGPFGFVVGYYFKGSEKR